MSATAPSDTFPTITSSKFPVLEPLEPTCECSSPDSVDTAIPTTPKNKFASPNDYFSIPVHFDGSQDLRGETDDFNMELPIRRRGAPTRNPSCSNSRAILAILTADEVEQATAVVSPSQDSSESSSAKTPLNLQATPMAYNDYGELVTQASLNIPKTPQNMTATEIIRVIHRAYHHDLRDQMGEIILEEMDGKISLIVGDGTLRGHHLTSWVFQSGSSPVGVDHGQPTPAEGINVQAPRGPPRILNVGCGSGTWCFRVKSANPNWIVHGVDDTNHWLCVHKDLPLRDFMCVASQENGQDYFARTEPLDVNPQFSVRNINTLTDPSNPLLMGSYSLVRGRQIFRKVQNYKAFLDSIRMLLQSDGVVEFLEVDPRPRIPFVGPYRKPIVERKTQSIRLADTIIDSDLAENVPGWSARVVEQGKASLRPLDGVPAANMKEWIEGAGFYDVKEVIIRLPVGGPTSSGQKHLSYLRYQLDLEDSIPKLRAELPRVEMDEFESGAYYLNLHIVTGRKPQLPRTGDLLKDGERVEMTPSTYDAMARMNDTKSPTWK
ncbi:hypothetical protein HYFRA_00005173, partial [Hymenoscyphus fraxineus]